MTVGADDGELKVFDMDSMQVIRSVSAHDDAVQRIVNSPTSSLLLSESVIQETKLWDISAERQCGATCLRVLPGCSLPSFSSDSSWIVGTRLVGRAADREEEDGTEWGESNQRHRATIYDVQTGKPVQTFEEPNIAWTYRDGGGAVFDPTGRLIVLDGKLYDTRSGTQQAVFDQLSNSGIAQFHPCGTEVIIGTAVWDVRMLGTTGTRASAAHKLLQVVPALDSCNLRFSPLGDALYAWPRINGHGDPLNGLKIVRVLDGRFFREMGQPLQLERFAQDLCVDDTDDYIAIVDRAYSPNDSYCRLFQVGRRTPGVFDSDLDDAQSVSSEEDEDEQDDAQWAANFGIDPEIWREMGAELDGDSDVRVVVNGQVI